LARAPPPITHGHFAERHQHEPIASRAAMPPYRAAIEGLGFRRRVPMFVAAKSAFRYNPTF
jgi:hypothetical protein